MKNFKLANSLLALCLLCSSTIGYSTDALSTDVLATQSDRMNHTKDVAVIQPDQAHIIPEQFVRRWDPVTLFFKSSVGKTAGTEERQPEKWVEMSPYHPGVYTWLNDTTLQFKPIEPWPALRQTSWKFDETTVVLDTLMRKPYSVLPYDGANNLEKIEQIELEFTESLDLNDLANMLKIEVTPLPALDSQHSTWLDYRDFTIKKIQNKNKNDRHRFIVTLNQTIHSGFKVTLHIQLGKNETLDHSFVSYQFQTQLEFQLTQAGCAYHLLPFNAHSISYSQAQALLCENAYGTNKPYLNFEFSAPIDPLSIVDVKNLIRIRPMVEGLEISQSGQNLYVYANFKTEQLYEIEVVPSNIKSQNKQTLNLENSNHFFVHFPKKSSFLSWKQGDGIMEVFGPQMLPMSGRGFEKVDLRIYPIDALDYNFWPFDDRPIVVNESTRPAGPGELSDDNAKSTSSITSNGLALKIKELGSPVISEIVNLPIEKGQEVSFGLDISKHLARIYGANQPGSYLVGVRTLDQSESRSWVRVQVTDLSLSVFEEKNKVKFLVTSLNSGLPIKSAVIDIDGRVGNAATRSTLATLITDENGMATLNHWDIARQSQLDRISISSGQDNLVLNPNNAPNKYKNAVWQTQYGWLDWLSYYRAPTDENGRYVCHLYTERPVYKPEDKVYLNGYVRWYDLQTLKLSKKNPKGHLVVNGPSGREWLFEIEANNSKDLRQIFEDDDLPTGYYSATYRFGYQNCGQVSFKKEAYKVPKFEVQIHGDDVVALDKEFEVEAIAEYYAGGQVVDQQISWKVTQVPYTWTPKTTEFKDFSFSSDSRFSGRNAFRASSNIYLTDKTDQTGSAKLSIDPTIEASLNPRSYVIEATVTDIDLQQVTNTQKVNAVPPLVLGLKVDRYFEKTGEYFADLIALDYQGKIIEGQKMQVRLIKRVWQSHLQATDFSNGEAKYITQVSESTVYEDTLVSLNDILKLPVTLEQAGVYVLEVSTSDKLGRRQEIALDFFVDGSQAVTWSKPPSDVFTVSLDKSQYNPGEVATMILESPFQNAMAMAVIEKPLGFDYELIEIVNGKASLELKIEEQFMPKLPVHFLLWRGRQGNFNVQARMDLGKPTTVASTKWINVSPINNLINVELDHAEQKQPGEELEIKINLSDYKDQPISAEVTLWLVDQAVLSLGNEQRLSIIDDFIMYRDSYMSITDTRNLGFGFIPLDTKVGGGLAMSDMAKEKKALTDNVTVRKNFKDVAFYDVISVDQSGQATVKIMMPDNLTKFKIRAKVESGDQLFGVAKSEVAVKLPVLVQPALPRFVRLGDAFVAKAIARVIDNTSGDSVANIKVNNVDLKSEDTQEFVLPSNTPVALNFDVAIPTKLNLESKQTADFQVAVARIKDKAKDAFKVSLPILSDQKMVTEQQLITLKPNETKVIEAIQSEVREQTLKGALYITQDERLLSLQSALSYLIQYPYGCTEQRISKAQSVLSYKQFDWLNTGQSDKQTDDIVNQTLDWIKTAKDENGLIGFWPGSTGYVFLTSISVRFMHQAEQVGFNVDKAFKRQLIDSLKRSLRKDYAYFITGEEYSERVMSLLTLKQVGQLDDSYVAELMRNAQFMNTQAKALLLQVLSSKQAKMDASIEQSLWDDMVFTLYQNEEVWSGFQSSQISQDLILPSDTQTLASSLQALINVNPNHPRVKVLLDGLFNLSSTQGWGSTRANATALDALITWIKQNKVNDSAFELMVDGKSVEVITMDSLRVTDNNQIKITNPNDFEVTVKLVRQYMPKLSGSVAANVNQGFVIDRNWIAVKDNKKIPIDQVGQQLNISLGEVIEEHVQIINPENRVQVAIQIPIAAGFEPLNPELNISSSDAKPSGQITLKPSYVQYLDDSVSYYYDQLPKGSFDFFFRVRATTQGEFTQPPANVQMMYNDGVWAQSFGAKVVINALDQ
ncbi:alpha-2-macroglobulin family protein [Marinicellulosiphila megalodicopiae]|uniref:alpha-2-macroglobulin family protein n=1 Tax=Marinicellulosiphila megalodicopiae TaxID=2724896 RepID=UPI003BAF2E11